MPILDFVCNNCGQKFEELVPLHGENTARCPNCTSSDLSRIYEGPCLFGMSASSGGGGCGGNCGGGCSGCTSCTCGH